MPLACDLFQIPQYDHFAPHKPLFGHQQAKSPLASNSHNRSLVVGPREHSGNTLQRTRACQPSATSFHGRILSTRSKLGGRKRCSTLLVNARKKDEGGTIIGIDLGTSNSAVAVIRDGSPVVIPVESSRATTPSMDKLGKDVKSTQIGVAAQFAASKDPLNSFYSIKRLIGREYNECARYAGSIVYSITDGPNGEARLWSPAREQDFSPEEISGMILKHLVQCAEKFLGETIRGAVIAVPAHFNQVQQNATLKAAELAGLKEVQLLQEPIAAAMAYGFHHNEQEETILVFDLGGGTYDVSVLEGFEGIFEVLATGGNSRLGGDDWDKAIADYCLQKCKADLRMEIRGRPELLHQLLDSVRLAKIHLTSQEESVVHVPSSKNLRGSNGFTMPITRKEMENITKPLRTKLGPPLAKLARDCQIEWPGKIPGFEDVPQHKQDPNTAPSQSNYTPKPRKISQVVLVGSATRIPSVRDFVKQVTGLEPSSWMKPEECVALGAAIQAGILLGYTKGIELADGSFSEDLHGISTGFQGQQYASL